MPISVAMQSRKESYPPTQIRLGRPSYYEESMEEDPLAYYLTPSDYLEAGMDDKRRSRSSVRHVLPSTLDELRFLSRRRISPSRSSSSSFSSSSSSDDDDEDYVRFRPGGAGYQPHFDGGLTRKPSRRYNSSDNDNNNTTPVDLSLQTRGRTPRRAPAAPGSSHARSVSRHHSTPRLWREPSPDVWSIAEAPEEDYRGLAGGGSLASERYLYEQQQRRKRSDSGRSMDSTASGRDGGRTAVERQEIAAFPPPPSKKKVRFAPLPRREDFYHH